MASQDVAAAALPAPAEAERGRSAVARFLEAWPPVVLLALAWIAGMLVVALFADGLAPYSFTALDPRARLSPPVFMGGDWRHILGSDELGRDVLSRLIASIRMSALIAFGATTISAVLGTSLGLLAAHFRGRIEQVVLALVDFQASMPFLIIALSVLAFFGNALPLFIALMGFHG
jgi:peptide/nickel transport system permease protein